MDELKFQDKSEVTDFFADLYSRVKQVDQSYKSLPQIASTDEDNALVSSVLEEVNSIQSELFTAFKITEQGNALDIIELDDIPPEIQFQALYLLARLLNRRADIGIHYSSVSPNNYELTLDLLITSRQVLKKLLEFNFADIANYWSTGQDLTGGNTKRNVMLDLAHANKKVTSLINKYRKYLQGENLHASFIHTCNANIDAFTCFYECTIIEAQLGDVSDRSRRNALQAYDAILKTKEVAEKHYPDDSIHEQLNEVIQNYRMWYQENTPQ